jgi:organic radical activating enzyme
MALDAEQLLERVRRLRPRNVVVTGGEPLVQRRELRTLLAPLQRASYRVEIETNGTIGPGDLVETVNQWNVSPKLAHSGNDGLRLIDASVLREFGATGQAWFKFVVSSPDDLEEIRSIAAEAGMDPSRIVLMPEGRTAREVAGRSAWLVDVCADYGYRFTTRLHILLWGDRRGT